MKRIVLALVCATGLFAARDTVAGKLKKTPTTGGQLSLFSHGRAKQTWTQLKQAYGKTLFKGMRLTGDVGQNPAYPGEYFVQLRDARTGAPRLASIKDGSPAVNAHTSALAWTSKHVLVVTTPKSSADSGASIGFTQRGVQGRFQRFEGVPGRVQEHPDGSLTIHGKSSDGRRMKQTYSAGELHPGEPKFVD